MSVRENLKEFFHFLARGRARQLAQVRMEHGIFGPTNAEAKHAEFVRNVDEIIDSQPIPIAPPPPPFINYEPKLDLSQHRPVYQLSEAQVERLQVSVRIGDVAWSIPQPRPGDDKDLQEGLDKLNQEIADLQGLGLVKDVSEHFKTKIANAMKVHGRHVRYYAPTGYTFQLFATKEYYREGDEIKIRERIIQ